MLSDREKKEWFKKIQINLMIESQARDQNRFNNDGSLDKSIRTHGDDYFNVKYSVCPFCLTKNETKLFHIPLKHGFHKSLGKCPTCNQLAQYKTLTEIETWTPEQFAKWCFDYALSGFWDKVNYKLFLENLSKMGWLDLFWQKYHDLKGVEQVEES